MKLTQAWDSLDPSLARMLRLHTRVMAVFIAIFIVAYAAGARSPLIVIDLIALSGALSMSLTTLLTVPYWGINGAVLGVTGAATMFAGVITWANPNLSPLIAMVMLLPLLFGFPHVSKRALSILMFYTVASGAAMVVIAEWRRSVAPELAWKVSFATVGFTVLAVSLVTVYLIRVAFARLAAQAEQLASSRERVVEVADATRRSIERDLHDGAQQRLLAMSVTIERARKALTAEDLSHSAALISQLALDNQEANRELREFARGIYPPLLAERGLVAALQSTARRAPVPVTLHAEGIGRLPTTVENPAYFCILEALNNALRHAYATEIVITLRADTDLEFFVVDDGRGFRPEVVTPNGILGMHARIEAARGELSIRSSPGTGATVHGRFPIH